MNSEDMSAKEKNNDNFVKIEDNQGNELKIYLFLSLKDKLFFIFSSYVSQFKFEYIKESKLERNDHS
jgi:hypothetical protein